MRDRSQGESRSYEDMFYIMQVLQSLEYLVKVLVLYEMDHIGAVDLVNNWNIDEQTRYINV